MNLKESFLKFCDFKEFEINQNQLRIIQQLSTFYKDNFSKFFWKKFFSNKEKKLGFYLVGDVGVGKTMILNFFFGEIKEKKLRLHFNEFMIEFHDFIFQNKEKDEGIFDFVKNLKKRAKILYFDEFQVTNIVDAMILGKLFEKIFQEKIKVIFSSNIYINDLYKDGLQREQFIPFIEILKKNSIEKELKIEEDYRLNNSDKIERFLSPLNQSNNFKLNKFFRKITKNKKRSLKILDVKGRKLKIENYYEGILRFNFIELFDKNLGSEDYIKISEISSFIFIENLPNFNENNSNQQQRFITFIDIIYEKKVPLMITSETDIKLLKSSRNLIDVFKRTSSRLYELTSANYK
tara:strand:+ start:1159 stop:2205 length:1047 start_codon:yes stop_codon:yes gene_type:complete